MKYEIKDGFDNDDIIRGKILLSQRKLNYLFTITTVVGVSALNA